MLGIFDWWKLNSDEGEDIIKDVVKILNDKSKSDSDKIKEIESIFLDYKKKMIREEM